MAASWPSQKMLRRAAQWDGVFPLRQNDPWNHLTPEEIREIARSVAQVRTASEPFEIACQGETRGDGTASETARVAASETTLDELLERVRRGPPRA